MPFPNYPRNSISALKTAPPPVWEFFFYALVPWPLVLTVLSFFLYRSIGMRKKKLSSTSQRTASLQLRMGALAVTEGYSVMERVQRTGDTLSLSLSSGVPSS